jgi:predicted transcriptional regulator
MRIPQTRMSPRVLAMNTPITHPGMTYAEFVRAERGGDPIRLPPSPIKTQTEDGLTKKAQVVLDLLAKNEKGLSQVQIMGMLKLTRSSIQNYVRLLIHNGSIENTNKSGNGSMYVIVGDKT